MASEMLKAAFDFVSMPPWGPRPAGTSDDDWLVIAYERATLITSMPTSSPESAGHYGALRGEVVRRPAARTADAELVEAVKSMRDSVLHGCGPLAEAGLDNDQVNAVLGVIDDALAKHWGA